MVTADQARDLKANWKEISMSSVANPIMMVVAKFYKKLVNHPGSKRFFDGVDLELQYFKMQGALTACIEFSDRLEMFADTIRRIGARHHRYNLTIDHMNDVADSLVPALREFCLDHGIEWDDYIEEAYDEWVEEVTGYFLEGVMAGQVAPPPQPTLEALATGEKKPAPGEPHKEHMAGGKRPDGKAHAHPPADGKKHVTIEEPAKEDVKKEEEEPAEPAAVESKPEVKVAAKAAS